MALERDREVDCWQQDEIERWHQLLIACECLIDCFFSLLCFLDKGRGGARKAGRWY